MFIITKLNPPKSRGKAGASKYSYGDELMIIIQA